MRVDEVVNRNRGRRGGANGLAGKRETAKRGGLARVVGEKLPLAWLWGAGYTPKTFEAVMGKLVGYPHEDWSLRMLARSARVPYSAVRKVCADLVDLGHVTVRAETLPGTGWSVYRHRLSPEGLAYWGGPVVAHGWLSDPTMWQDAGLAPVMGSRLASEDRARGEAVGYSFPVLYRVADVLVFVPSREWSVRDLASAAGADTGMVRLACLDLVAAGHATSYDWTERGGRERAETRFAISVNGIIAWVPWLPHLLDT